MTFETQITYLLVRIDDGHADHPHIGMCTTFNHETIFYEYDRYIRCYILQFYGVESTMCMSLFSLFLVGNQKKFMIKLKIKSICDIWLKVKCSKSFSLSFIHL